MLTTSATNEVAVVLAPFAWSDTLTARYDSHWMRDALFCALNGVTPGVLRVMRAAGRCHPHTRSHFQAERDRLPALGPCEEALTDTYRLRYCTACIAIGYHAYLHQLKVVNRCLLHDLPLEYACQACGGPMVSLDCGSGRQVHRCGSCHAPILTGGPSSWVKSYAFLRQEREAFEDLDGWLVRCRRWRCRYRPIKQYGLPRSFEPDRELSIMALHALPPLPASIRANATRHTLNGLTVHKERVDGGDKGEPIPPQVWRPIYRSIRRYLQRQWRGCRQANGCRCGPWRLRQSVRLQQETVQSGCAQESAFAAWCRCTDWLGDRMECQRPQPLSLGRLSLEFWAHGLLARFYELVAANTCGQPERPCVTPHPLETYDPESRRRQIVFAYWRFGPQRHSSTPLKMFDRLSRVLDAMQRGLGTIEGPSA
jgi:hypothetical protein